MELVYILVYFALWGTKSIKKYQISTIKSFILNYKTTLMARFTFECDYTIQTKRPVTGVISLISGGSHQNS